MRVEIWSDIVCPWCYIGKRNFEAALAGFEHRDEVEVAWRAFELDPKAPRLREGSYEAHLASKYGVPLSEGRAMLEHMTAKAAAVGLDFRFDRARPGNTFDAHRLAHLGAHHGVADSVQERLLAATFHDGEPIGDHDTLVRLGADAGLDPEEVRSVLETDAYAEEVRADERLAASLDITSVPFFVVDRAYGLSGAHPPEALRRVLERALAEAS